MSWSEVEDLDVDIARNHLKFSYWLRGPDADLVASAAKEINRYLFLDLLRKRNRGSSTATLASQLYVLTRAVTSLRRRTGGTEGTFLDAGCGGGYLLLAWCRTTGGSALGVDSDLRTLALAGRLLCDDNIVEEATQSRTWRPEITLFRGDALQFDIPAPGALDAINVGVAVKTLDELEPLGKLLRVGGTLTVPIMQGPSVGLRLGRHACLLQTLFKTSEGKLQRESGDPDILCYFFPRTPSY